MSATLPESRFEQIAQGMDAAAAALSKSIRGMSRSDPIYRHLHEAMNAMAAVRILASTAATPRAEHTRLTRCE